MDFIEDRRNIFYVDSSYFLVHCIAEDARMGAGIAVDFTNHFPEIKKLRKMDLKVGSCVKIDRVFNLITKKRSSGKPIYQTLTSSLIQCKDICLKEDIKKLAMPKIGCGLDRLQWPKVREIIQDVFKDTSIEILICII